MVVGSSVSRKGYEKKTNTIPYKFLCNTKVPCSISNIPYTVVGLSVSQKASDKVFLNCHIWSLDRQCLGKHVTKFSCIAIYGRRTVSVTEIVRHGFPDFCQVA